MVNIWSSSAKQNANTKSRNLFAACLAHMLHDGYTDQLYALMPAWQALVIVPLVLSLRAVLESGD